MGVVFQLFLKFVIDGAAADDEVSDAPQLGLLLSRLQ